ncbi:MAG: DNA repair protein RecN [Alphaproteobacteria bacterium]|nr:DNA repair protein RecN [Alphaproteobacteria bacterium]
MLRALSIRDVVIIERLDVVFESGLCVLTGETGAGKSILLDALGLALGERSSSRLVRSGADRSIVTAEFSVNQNHPAFDLLGEQGLDCDNPLILRRILESDGKSRAFINDQPVSVGFLKKIGESLIEIHGQFDRLLDPSSHRTFLDGYAQLGTECSKVALLYSEWKSALVAYQEAAQAAVDMRTNENFLRHTLDELDIIDLKAGEEEELTQKRNFLMHAAKLVEALQSTFDQLVGEGGAENRLNIAYRLLEKVREMAVERLTPILETLDRATAETTEALSLMQSILSEIPEDRSALEHLEERLFKLRALARKHGCTIDELATLRDKYKAQLHTLENNEGHLQELQEISKIAATRYYEAALNLSRARQAAALKLDELVLAELPPLKMDKARFRTQFQTLPETQWSAEGIDKVEFEIAPNPGMPFGGLGLIASGGERSRLMLALKVVLAQAGNISTFIFDEIDSGVGGAVARAVGERLAHLGRTLQVLVITHSPQVASMASYHWRIEKNIQDQTVQTNATLLDLPQRREEVARMLSGDKITDEARAAADQLMLERIAG